jgi:general secretion pathway protein D
MKKYILIMMLMINIGWANNICNNKLFTFEITSDANISLSDALNSIVVKNCYSNIIYDDELAKKRANSLILSDIYIKNYNIKQILNLLVSNNNFFYKLENNTLHIGYIRTKTFSIDYIPSKRTGSSTFKASSVGDETTSDTNSVDSQYQFDFWNGLASNLENILNADPTNYKAPTPIIDKNAGLISITGTKKQLSAINEYINKLNNRLHEQILIDVKIYEVELSKSHTTGVNWSQFNLSLAPQSVLARGVNIFGKASVFSNATFNVGALLDFLSTQGNVNSVSNPKIAALNNQKAILSVGDTINYKYPSKVISTATATGTQVDTQYTYGSKFVGILLDITPEISEKGDIILRINPTVSTFRDVTQLSNPTRDLAPDTSENKMSTVVRIKDGQTLVMGGLITNSNSFSANGVSLLKEIPVIKYLFSSKSEISNKRELVFIVTPHIVKQNKTQSIKSLGF